MAGRAAADRCADQRAGLLVVVVIDEVVAVRVIADLWRAQRGGVPDAIFIVDKQAVDVGDFVRQVGQIGIQALAGRARGALALRAFDDVVEHHVGDLECRIGLRGQRARHVFGRHFRFAQAYCMRRPDQPGAGAGKRQADQQHRQAHHGDQRSFPVMRSLS